MPETGWERMWSLFHAALDVEAGRRDAFLDAACGDDLALRRELAALLASHGRSEGLLDRSPVKEGAGVDVPSDPLVGTRLGAYHVRDRIGEGGMGVVYDAEQESPVRRRVALKVIRPGMHADVVARFAVERQALALMSHPHIARVFDAGVTPDGRPFFVMEHVAGVPLGDYCDRNALDLLRRLDLFLAVCQAIEHAHQKGVIHRDIKPSNVLVTVEDGVATPKVIDFGVAKPIHRAVDGEARRTRHELLVGTLEYMSPEQLDPSGLDVDTRSDIYSLGVVLYELLAGTLPFDGPALREAGSAGPRRPGPYAEPAPASRRFRELSAERRRAVAETRRTTAGALERQLAGDLDWILIKALDRDRTRRYATASELAADLRRHLASEPVQAGPPRASYRMAKFVRRHRAAVTAAVAGTALVVAFAVATALQAREVRRALASADQERARAERVSEFLTQVFEASDPYRGGGREATAREVLDRGAERVRRELAGEPEVQAAVMSAVGRVYAQLGVSDQAERLLGEALAVRRRLHAGDHPQVAESLEELGRVRGRAADYGAAGRLYEEAHAMRTRLFGADDPRRARSLYLLGALRRSEGKFDEAERLLREALRLSGRAPAGAAELDTTAGILEELGNVARQKGDFPAAESRFREALALRRQQGPGAPQTAATLGRLGTALSERGDLDAAEPLLREALDVLERHFGPDHHELEAPLNNLALLLHNRSDYAAAESLYGRSLAIKRRLYGGRHPSVAIALNNLALLAHDRGRLDEAAGLFEEALSILRQVHGDSHPDLAYPTTNLARVRHDQRRFAEAENLYRRGLELRKALPAAHPARADSLAWWGKLMADRGRPVEGEPLLREAVEIRTAAHGADDWRTAEARNLLGAALAGQGRYAEAEPLLVEGFAILERKRGARYRRTLQARERVAALYESWNRPQDAARYRIERDAAGPEG